MHRRNTNQEYKSKPVVIHSLGAGMTLRGVPKWCQENGCWPGWQMQKSDDATTKVRLRTISPNGRYIVTYLKDELKVWNTITGGVQLHAWPRDQLGEECGMAFFEKKEVIATVMQVDPAVKQAGTVWVRVYIGVKAKNG